MQDSFDRQPTPPPRDVVRACVPVVVTREDDVADGVAVVRDRSISLVVSGGRRSVAMDDVRGVHHLRGARSAAISTRDQTLRIAGPDLGVWLARLGALRGERAHGFLADDVCLGGGPVLVGRGQAPGWLVCVDGGLVLVCDDPRFDGTRWFWEAVQVSGGALSGWQLEGPTDVGLTLVSGEGVAAVLAARAVSRPGRLQALLGVPAELKWGPIWVRARMALGGLGVGVLALGARGTLPEPIVTPWSSIQRVELSGRTVSVVAGGGTVVFRPAFPALIRGELRRLRAQAARLETGDPDALLWGMVRARRPGEPWSWGSLAIDDTATHFVPAGCSSDAAVVLPREGLVATRLGDKRRPSLNLRGQDDVLEVVPAEGEPFVEAIEQWSGAAVGRFRGGGQRRRVVRWMLSLAHSISVTAGDTTWELEPEGLVYRDGLLRLGPLHPPLKNAGRLLSVEVASADGAFEFVSRVLRRVYSSSGEPLLELALPAEVVHHEARRDRRVAWALPVWVDAAGRVPKCSGPPHGEVVDISPTGAQVRSTRSLPFGEVVGLGVRVQGRLHLTQAEVVRAIDRNTVALRFLDPPAALAQQVLRRARDEDRARLKEHSTDEVRAVDIP